MKTRTDERKIPDLPHYWHAVIGTNGEHVFRIPSQLGCLKLSRKTAKLQEASEDGTERAITNLAHAGMMIGEMWAHPTEDLETDRATLRNDAEYGEAIHEELHEAGYTSKDVNDLMTGLSERVRAEITGSEDVAKREDFTEASVDTGT
ncbi:hypothetical protein HN937_13450 [Candidatus Poribacteria bacterium]|jgi:hypothetical protein|nr:hypothetical protein [Candidatus Poribacteria bacterium]